MKRSMVLNHFFLHFSTRVVYFSLEPSQKLLISGRVNDLQCGIALRLDSSNGLWFFYPFATRENTHSLPLLPPFSLLSQEK